MKMRRFFWETAIGVIATAVLCSAASAGGLRTVEISIKPNAGSTNTMNAFAKGNVPVAILGSDSFDVTDVDVTTLAFGPAGAAPVHRVGGHLEDVNDDGLLDLISHYAVLETGFVFDGTITARLTGETLAGESFDGSDVVRIVQACGIGFELAFLLPPLMWLYGRRGRRVLH